jgi:uncharacterized protein YjbJ (UPF0337 family)
LRAGANRRDDPRVPGVEHFVWTGALAHHPHIRRRAGVKRGVKAMNWDQIKGKWHQVKGSIRAKWGELTDDEIEELDGNREKMVGKIQEKYGVAKEEAEKQVDEWTKGHG